MHQVLLSFVTGAVNLYVYIHRTEHLIPDWVSLTCSRVGCFKSSHMVSERESVGLSAIETSGGRGVGCSIQNSNCSHIFLASFLPSLLAWRFFFFFLQGAAPRLKKARAATMGIWVFFFCCYLALAIEDNSSWFAGVPNSEYVRVMTDIMDTGAAASQREGAAAYPGDDGAFDRRRDTLTNPLHGNGDGLGGTGDPLFDKLDALQHRGS